MRNSLFPLTLMAAASLLTGAQFALAQPGDVSVDLVSTLHYPNPGFTLADVGQINDKGGFVGSLLQGSVVVGFTGNANGSVSQPFAEPDDSVGFTSPNGIRNGGTICGRYDSAGTTHGFFRRGGIFKSYDAPVPNVFATAVDGLNNEGDFVGIYTVSGGSGAFAYATIDGVFITIPISGDLPEASAINNLTQVVGSYGDSMGFHGFLRDPDGTVTSPIDFPGATQTVPMAINDAGYIVGYWTDDRTAHAFVIHLPETFVTYDVPEAIGTSFTGINSAGLISGIYTDKQRRTHILIAQLQVQ